MICTIKLLKFTFSTGQVIFQTSSLTSQQIVIVALLARLATRLITIIPHESGVVKRNIGYFVVKKTMRLTDTPIAVPAKASKAVWP